MPWKETNRTEQKEQFIKETLQQDKPFKHLCAQFGISEKNKKQIHKATDSIANRIRKNNGKVKPGIKTKIFFSIMRSVQKSGWNEADVKYWNEKGWDGKKRPWKS